jgi:hypothetical protein
MDASTFYRLRDDRTDECLEGAAYGARAVAISIDDEAASTYPGQLAFVLAVNLVARWCRRLNVSAPPVAVAPQLTIVREMPPTDLAGLALDIARAADPFGDFTDSQEADRDPIRLHIGAGPASPGAYRIQGVGWLALTGEAVHSAAARPNDRPLGAALAACIGAAWAFRVAIGEPPPSDSLRLSLWNLQGGEAALDHGKSDSSNLGNVLLVGCGAVGSSIAYLLPLMGITGRLTLVDGDRVDATNLNRSPLFFFADVDRSKADTVASYLRRSGVVATSLEMWFDEAVSTGLAFRGRPDIVIPAANDRGVRHAIQHHVPPLQVYGTTSRDWQAFLGRHIPLHDDCLACRFPIDGPATPPLVCATASLPTSRPEVPTRDAALPFLSTAAAVLAVAELAKATEDSFPVNANFACLDFKGPLTDFLAVQTHPSPGCICQSQRQVAERLNSGTRFARRFKPTG